MIFIVVKILMSLFFFSGYVWGWKGIVNSTKIVWTSNFDAPDGGFDALLQAMVCQDEIGWRKRSRRLIVFATDAHSHIAGNGRVII